MSTVYIRFSNRPEDSRPHRRAPVLERLLARAAPSVATADWRDDAFAVIAPAGPVTRPAVGPAASRKAGGSTTAAYVCVATPLALTAGMSTVSLPADGILTLEALEAERLAADFKEGFADTGATLRVGAGAARLFCEFDRPLRVSTHDPEHLLTHDVFDSQPTGEDAGALRRLMSEMEMWLYDHPVNRDRAGRGLPQISSVWLWGGGAPLAHLPTVLGWTTGGDPLFGAFDERQAFPTEGGAGVVVSTLHPDDPSWTAFEERWLRPALEALRTRTVERVALSAGSQRFDVARGSWWTTWRRTDPWWESLAGGVEAP